MTCENCVSFKVCHAVALAGKVANAEFQCDYFIDKDLINRQKAEIERLQKMQQLTKAEAVKKCIEKIQLRSSKSVMIDHGIQVAGSATYWISEVTLCEIEKEMVGDTE